MKQINVLSVSHAFKSLNSELHRNYFDYSNSKIKDSELVDLNSLIDEMQQVSEEHDIYNHYYLGYKIPQINKEFDLLRFGNNYIVNIELKSTSTEEKIIDQLRKNLYYLKFVGIEVYNFTYVSDVRKVYKLDSDELKETDLYEVIDILEKQEVNYIADINSLFKPSNYLVSPFNSTKNFLRGEYFLTQQQNEFKNNILKELSTNKAEFIAISGEAGTGKTLLTYDIVKYFLKKELRVLVVHCGKLNKGHLKLNSSNWEIISIKNLNPAILNKYSLIVIDETQRIRKSQLELVIDYCEKHKGKCIFTYDEQQCLKKAEIENETEKNIIGLTGIKPYKLTKSIRTNKEINDFITGLFNKNILVSKIDKTNVNLHYFNNYLDAKKNIESLDKDWKIINLTPSLYTFYPYDEYIIDDEENAHDVIGQEYDNVAVIIDSYFYYDGNKLSTKGYGSNPIYHPTKMLYQILSRARMKLHIVVLNNTTIMERCLEMCS